jgi:hypothetical protein
MVVVGVGRKLQLMECGYVRTKRVKQPGGFEPIESQKRGKERERVVKAFARGTIAA